MTPNFESTHVNGELACGKRALPPVPRCDAGAQEKAARFVQTAMLHYWHGGDPQRFERELFPGITLKGRFDRVEENLREACRLLPGRLDLRFGLASTLVTQNRVDNAMAIYRDIWNADPHGFEAPILLAAFARALGRQSEFEAALRHLEMTHPERAATYRRKFERAEQIIATEVRVQLSRSVAEGKHAIVVLGYALARDGSLQPTKLRRLEKVLEVAAVYPDSPIVLTGGVQQSGVTEAFIMSRWLQEKGIAAHRLRLEDQAEDTVGNAVFSVPILQTLGVERATLVTSASHVRRALVVFAEAAEAGRESMEFDHVAEMDLSSEPAAISSVERVFVFRDLVRASGIWAYPGVQR